MSSIAPASRQLMLLDVKPSGVIQSNAHARNAYGGAIQELVCAALGLLPIPINGSYEICFDAEDGRGRYYEIKSFHRFGKLVIYDWRAKKEAGAGVDLSYAILVHSVRGARSYASLWEQLRQTPSRLVVVPASVVHDAAAKVPLRKVEKPCADARNGYNRIGYKEGYRNVPIPAVTALCEKKSESGVVLFGETYPVEFWGLAPCNNPVPNL